MRMCHNVTAVFVYELNKQNIILDKRIVIYVIISIEFDLKEYILLLDSLVVWPHKPTQKKKYFFENFFCDGHF